MFDDQSYMVNTKEEFLDVLFVFVLECLLKKLIPCLLLTLAPIKAYLIMSVFIFNLKFDRIHNKCINKS